MSETIKIWWVVFKPLIVLLVVDIILIALISRGHKDRYKRGRK